MKYIAEDCVQELKEIIYSFIDNLKDIDDLDRAKLGQNIALNLICQITIEMALPSHDAINEGFDELLLDIDIWRNSYIFDHPERTPEDQFKEICDRLRPTSVN